MKIYTFLAIIFISCSTLFSQDIFEKYKKDSSVSYINVSPKMFEMLSKLNFDSSDSNMNDFREIVGKLEHFKVLASKNKSVAEDMEAWLKDQQDQIGIEPIMKFSEQGANVQFYTDNQSKTSVVNKLVMYVKGVEEVISKSELNLSEIDYVLLYIEGEINLNQVSALAGVVKIPKGNFLKKLN